MSSTVLLEHGTGPNPLRPINIYQAARTDLRLLELKRDGKADEDRPYSFMRKHVVRANDAVHLIALAYFANWTIDDTNKHSTRIIYHDRDLLRRTLIELLQGADEDTLRHSNEVR